MLRHDPEDARLVDYTARKTYSTDTMAWISEGLRLADAVRFM
jgi:hypothetical protein